MDMKPSIQCWTDAIYIYGEGSYDIEVHLINPDLRIPIVSIRIISRLNG